jgi:PAS domain S-box-containing protein
LVEDSEEDALLLLAHLNSEGFACDLTQVDELEPLQTALKTQAWDLLLTDFSLPTLDGLAVLREAKRLAPTLPCIVVSGQIGEEAAVEALHAGAKDFVSKFRMARLLPAIRRELAESRVRVGADLARAELRTSEDRFRAITGAALDGIVMIDPDGRVSFWNQAAQRIFGYTEEEALGSDLHLLIAPARFRDQAGQGLARFLASGQGGAMGRVSEAIGCHKDGSEFPIELSLAALQEGDTWHAVGVVRDITARRALEREQSENLQFHRTLIETLPNPLYYEDQEGHILGCNQALQGFLGLPLQQILGKHAEELLPEVETRWPEPSEQAASGRLDVHEAAFQRTQPDGRIQHVIFRKAPYFRAQGGTAGYVATLLDVTRLKETEQALRRNESLFSAIHRHVVDLIAIIDSEGHRLYNSPSYRFVLGYSEAEMAAHSALDLLHPEDVERVSTALRGLMAGRATQGLEYRLRHKDGQWLHFESTAALIPDADGGAMRALVVARNVTERKAAEQSRSAMEVQLRQAQKLEAIGQLAAGIAHEINTPTQYIGDNAAFLRDSCNETFSIMGRLQACLMEIQALGGPAAEVAGQGLKDLAATDLDFLGTEIPKAIQQSIEGVGRISKIVKAMKDFSHPGGESKTPTDLHQAIESTITVSRNEWKYVANLVTDFDPDLPLVPCYPSEFNQVVLNLIVNAAHAIESAKGGRDSGVLGQITVRTRGFADTVEVSVSDDGTGIPEAVQARMFEPFYTTKPIGKGSGQGLAIAHAVIVEKHQGRIDVHSEIGQGTTFILRLPLKGNGTAEEGTR